MPISVLVTRPRGQGDELCAALAGAGYNVHSLPMLELVPVPELPPAQRQLVLALDRYQHIIFVSGNAVHFGMACIAPAWPRLPVGPTWYAVGDSTARLLLPYGVRARTPGSMMTSEGLLALPQLQHVAGQRVLIVKGEGGRTTLAAELANRGATVDQLGCYRRVPPELGPGELALRLSQWHIAVVMISSGEGLTNLLGLLRPAETSKFIHITFLVPSERVAQMAAEAGLTRVITAENASDSAMLRALAALKPSLESTSE
jgi:uroporphyrinogen-III synthase